MQLDTTRRGTRRLPGTWGAAYCVRGGQEKERAVMEYLEHRECEYDGKTLVDFFMEGGVMQPAINGVVIFTATPDKELNKFFLGPAPLEDMARQIATASGPCGNNREYIFMLEKALFDIGHEEDMIIEVANEVRKVLGIMSIRIPKERRLSGLSHMPKSIISPHKVLPPEAIVMDF